MSVPSVDSDPRYRQVILIVLVVGLVIAPVMLGSRAPWAWALNGLIVIVMAALWLLRACAKGALRIRRTVLDLPIVVLFCLAIASTFGSIYRYGSALETARLASYIVLYYVIINNLAGRDAVRTTVRCLVVLGFVLSAYGIYEVASGSEQILWMSKSISRGLVSSTFSDAATFGGFLSLIVPLGAGAALDSLSRHRWGEGVIFSTCAAVVLAGLVGTFNRSSWAGTLVALVAMALVALYRSPAPSEYRRGVLAGGLLLMFIVAGAASRSAVDRFLAAFEGDGSSTAARYEYFLSSIEMMRDRPMLGFGPGTYQYVWRSYRLPAPPSVSRDAVYAHNEYAQYGAEMGVAAPLLIVWLLIAHIARGLRTPLQPGIDWVAAALTASPVGLASANIAYFHWHIPATAELFWVVLGLSQVWLSSGRGPLPRDAVCS
jgi:putative inorganic carbon (HCO3(-)) transporter